MIRKRPVRTVNQSTQDWILYLRIFRELLERPRVAVPPSVELEERRHLKTLRQRLEGTGITLDAYLREFLSLDDRWLDERDYPLRQAVRADHWVMISKRLQPTEHDLAPTTMRTDRAAFEAERARKDAERRARLERCTCGRGGAAAPCPVHFAGRAS